MSEREYQKDLDACDKAKQWSQVDDWALLDKDKKVICTANSDVIEFIATAREALPYYIKRCMELEAGAATFKEALDELIKQIYENECAHVCKNCTKCSLGIVDFIQQEVYPPNSTAGQDLLDRMKAQDEEIKRLRTATNKAKKQILEEVPQPDLYDVEGNEPPWEPTNSEYENYVCLMLQQAAENAVGIIDDVLGGDPPCTTSQD